MANKRRWTNASLLLLAIGCGPSELGEECDDVGSTDDCEDGTICTNIGKNAICLLLCAEQAQCLPGSSCKGVEKTNFKSCQPE